MKDCLRQLPKRSSRYGVGKEIGGSVYLHRSYENRFGDVVLAAKENLPDGFSYEVVKYDYRTNSVSFVQCKDFDTTPEPTVGEIVTVDAEGHVRRRQQSRDSEIYHHKWLFVADDYDGFDVRQSRQRSLSWMALDGVDRKRIGRKSYWETTVVPRLRSRTADP